MKFKKKILIAHFLTTINFSMFLKALYFLFFPPVWFHLRTWSSTTRIEKQVLKYVKWERIWKIISFYNCRSAIYHWLRLMWIRTWDEVIIQSFTCVSVPNSVIQTWAKPIYVDIDDGLNMDPDLIKSKISKNTKAILIQHTFWNPAQIELIKAICKKFKIFLIEDCAHCLWSEKNSKKLWSYWDIACFSFWRDKVVSSVNWGFLIVNNEELISKSWLIEVGLKDAPFRLVLQNLSYIVISYLSKISYEIYIWKAIMHFSRKFWIVPELLSQDEKRCASKLLDYKLPNCLAYIWIGEFAKIEKYNHIRMKNARTYNDYLSTSSHLKWIKIEDKSLNIYLRYPILIKNKTQLISHFRKNNVLLWDWYSHIIDPKWVNLSDCQYTIWSCKKAEQYSKMCINLPNHYWVSISDCERVIELLKKYSK